jgi:hypothetical protein
LHRNDALTRRTGTADFRPLPGRWRVLVTEREGDRARRGVRQFDPTALPDGDVVVRVEWSSVYCYESGH